MSFAELLANARTLPRVQRLRFVQALVDQLAREEDVAPLDATANYPLLTPFGNEEAAYTLRQMLDAEASPP